MDRYESLRQRTEADSRKKKVAAYCRVSTDHEDQANSFDSQQRYFRHYIEHHADWELYQVYADEGITGTNTKKRKEFNRMIAAALQGEFDLIITKEISRFARNTLDSIYYTRDLKRHGVGVIFLNDNINTLDGDAELRLAIMSSIAQEESRRTSERVKWGQKRRMEQGIVFGRSMLGYDVSGGQMAINEEGAEIVRRIFHKFVHEHKGTSVIARELGEEGFCTIRGKRWQNTGILRVLRNEKYCGDLVQKKTYTPDFLSHEKKSNKGQEEFVIIRDHHEPIISRELFEEAGRLLDERSHSQEGKPKYSARYPFSGKLRCGCCGGSYVARRRERKDGSFYQAWRCQRAARYGSPHTTSQGEIIGCGGRSIPHQEVVHIMSLVTASAGQSNPHMAERLLSVIRQVLARVHTPMDHSGIHRRLSALEEKHRRLIEIYISGAISREEFIEARTQCESEIVDLRKKMEDENPQGMKEDSRQLLQEITNTVRAVLEGEEWDEQFYGEILERAVITDRGQVDVYLRDYPQKWSYTC